MINMTNMTNTTQDIKIDSIIKVLRDAHDRTTQGCWVMGSQINETSARVNDVDTDVAKFRRVDDARFCDLTHAFLPRVLDEIKDLQEQVLYLSSRLNNYEHNQ